LYRLTSVPNSAKSVSVGEIILIAYWPKNTENAFAAMRLKQASEMFIVGNAVLINGWYDFVWDRSISMCFFMYSEISFCTIFLPNTNYKIIKQIIKSDIFVNIMPEHRRGLLVP
jgi:hypothetical protein